MIKIIKQSDKAILKEYKGKHRINPISCQCFGYCDCSEEKAVYEPYHYYYIKSLNGKKSVKRFDLDSAIERFNFLNNLK
ncbi:hypothetical protein P12024L_55 [Nonlabens phage P12024L]|uniref:Uncharacterized protein n=2 Tax=Inhavirus TaxID=1982244 RepID=I6S6W3_9CAUD|nr:hypothetical protein B617_gp56 [Nonlabens phage P12024S]YP_006560454.1 hypothetical protein B618_gp55 [Nonlabens phage P12024L]AFM54717.1 hypothetical protein P12024S_56 [Nonlabens phage P12024S]AFM54775.1 hypothetical protein P12024L_55 [Nonlabens phage P12024L]